MRTTITYLLALFLTPVALASTTQWVQDRAYNAGVPTDEWRATTESAGVVVRSQWSIDFSAVQKEEVSYPGCPSSLVCFEFIIDAPLEIAVGEDAIALEFRGVGVSGQEMTWTFLRDDEEAVTYQTELNTSSPVTFIPPGTTTIRVDAQSAWRLRGIATYQTARPQHESNTGLNVSTKAFIPGAAVVVDPLNEQYLFRITNGELDQSSDLGDSWNPLDPPVSRVLKMAPKPGASHVLLAIGAEGLVRSVDRGWTWSTVLERPMGDNADVHWSSNVDQMLIVADERDVWISADDGLTWLAQPNLPEPASKVVGANRSFVWILGESGVLYRQREEAWEPDSRWSFLEGISDATATQCGVVAIVGGVVWRAMDTASAPAVRTIMGRDGAVLDIERSAEYCGIILLTEDGRIIDTDQRLFRAVTAQLPEELRPTTLEVHSVRFSQIDAPHFLPVDDTLVIARMSSPDRCSPDECDQTFQFLRTGFYVARLSLEPGEREGLFGLSLNATPKAGFAAGAVLPAGGVQPGFISFSLGFESSVSALLSEYTGNVDRLTLELRQINTDGTRTTVWGPEQRSANSTVETPVVGPGRFILSIRSEADDPKGRFGVSLQADSFMQGVDLGGWIDDSEQQPFMAFFTNGRTDFTVFAEDSYPGLGAPQPDLSVRFQVPAGERVLVYPSELEQLSIVDGDIDRITDRFGNQLVSRSTSVALSGDGSTVAALVEDYDGDDLVDTYRWQDGRLELEANIAALHGTTGGFSFLSRWAVNDNGTSLVFRNSGEPFFYHYSGGQTQIVALPDEGSVIASASLIMNDLLVYIAGIFDDSPAYGYLIPDQAWNELPEQPDSLIGSSAFARDTAVGWLLESDGTTFQLVQWDLLAGQESGRTPLTLPKRRSDSVVEARGIGTSNDGEAIIMVITEHNPQKTLIRFQRVFSFDAETDEWTLVSAYPDGSELERLASRPLVSGDGKSVFFRVPEASEASRPNSYEASFAILRKNMDTGALERVVASVVDPEIYAADDTGSTVVFSSYDGKLVPYDTNFRDTFVWRASP